MQISASRYQTLKPGTTGLFCPDGVPCTPVVFKGCDGVTVRIEGNGIRPEWHTGLHAGLLKSLFSWDILAGRLEPNDFRYEELSEHAYFVKDLAHLLSVSESTVYRWHRTGKIKLIKTWGRGPLRAPKSHLYGFLKYERPDLISRFRLSTAGADAKQPRCSA